MPIDKQITQKQEESVTVSEDVCKNCCCSESFFDKKLIAACLLSTLIAGLGIFSIMKLGMSTTEEEVKVLYKNYEALDERLKNVKKLVLSLDSSLSSLTNDVKSGQDNFAYIYSKIASIQKDVSTIKEKFHIEDTTLSDEMRNMSAGQISFIETLETLVKEGAPFAEFLKSYDEKFDITTYVSGKNLLEFVDAKVLSIDELQKIFINVGQSEFGISLNETFWEKQKRIIKEKFVSAITIKQDEKDIAGKENTKYDKADDKVDDKNLFAKASEYMKNEKIEQAIEVLEKIERGHSDITKFISQAKQRIALDRAFAGFKKEFISVSANPSKQDEKTE